MSYYMTPSASFDPTATPQPGQFGSLGAVSSNTGGAPSGWTQPDNPASGTAPQGMVLNPGQQE